MKLTAIEYVVNNKGDILVTEQDERPYVFNQTHRHIITDTLEMLKEEFEPSALECLEKRYSSSRQNKMHFEFQIVRMWIKLHHSHTDGLLDVDELGNMNFEHTYCAKRGECDSCDVQAACYPVRRTNLRKSEINVLRLIVLGMDEATIADTLCNSLSTIKNHRSNMQKRLGLHKTSELIAYWHANHMK